MNACMAPICAICGASGVTRRPLLPIRQQSAEPWTVDECIREQDKVRRPH